MPSRNQNSRGQQGRKQMQSVNVNPNPKTAPNRAQGNKKKRRSRNTTKDWFRNSPSLTKARGLHCDVIDVTEPLESIIVPADSPRGTKLQAIEINPLTLGKSLQARGLQNQSWAGNFRFHVRTNGSVNTRNYAQVKFLPNASLANLPADGNELWRTVRAKTTRLAKQGKSDREFVKFNIISDRECTVDVPWDASFNPIKPVQDSDESERSLGVLIFVSNGPPGEAMQLDIDVDCFVYFCGPTPRSVMLNNSVLVTGTPSSLTTPFATYTVKGPGSTQVDPSLITLRPGTYSIDIRWIGTGITVQPPVITSVAVTNNYQYLTATSASYKADIRSTSDITFQFNAVTAATVTSVIFQVSNYDIT